MNQLTTLLSNHCFSIYEEEVTVTETTLKCRLVPLNTSDTSLALAEVYAVKFIQGALAFTDPSWSIEASRPWLLKDGKLRFTWKFVIKGDMEAAYRMLRTLDKAPTAENTTIPVTKSVSTRGTVTVKR